MSSLLAQRQVRLTGQALIRGRRLQRPVKRSLRRHLPRRGYVRLLEELAKIYGDLRQLETQPSWQSAMVGFLAAQIEHVSFASEPAPSRPRATGAAHLRGSSAACPSRAFPQLSRLHLSRRLRRRARLHRLRRTRTYHPRLSRSAVFETLGQALWEPVIANPTFDLNLNSRGSHDRMCSARPSVAVRLLFRALETKPALELTRDRVRRGRLPTGLHEQGRKGTRIYLTESCGQRSRCRRGNRGAGYCTRPPEPASAGWRLSCARRT